ncbi:hypothetical protein ACWLZS_003306 [Vibrio parahaemolyticus]
MAFFLALFSGVEQLESSSILRASANLFAMSLIFNSALAIIISLYEREAKLLHKLNQSRYFGWVFTLGTASFLLAILSLLFSFSTNIGVFGVVSASAVLMLFWLTNKELKASGEK